MITPGRLTGTSSKKLNDVIRDVAAIKSMRAVPPMTLTWLDSTPVISQDKFFLTVQDQNDVVVSGNALSSGMLSSGGMSGSSVALFNRIDNLPTQNRWYGWVGFENSGGEMIYFEGTSGGMLSGVQGSISGVNSGIPTPSGQYQVGIVARTVNPNINDRYHSGGSGQMKVYQPLPEVFSGVNLLTFEKGQYAYQHELDSGFIGVRVVPQMQIVQLLSGSEYFDVSGINYFPGQILYSDMTKLYFSGMYSSGENIYIHEMNGEIPAYDKAYHGFFMGHSVQPSGFADGSGDRYKALRVYGVDASAASPTTISGMKVALLVTSGNVDVVQTFEPKLIAFRTAYQSGTSGITTVGAFELGQSTLQAPSGIVQVTIREASRHNEGIVSLVQQEFKGNKVILGNSLQSGGFDYLIVRAIDLSGIACRIGTDHISFEDGVTTSGGFGVILTADYSNYKAILTGNDPAYGNYSCYMNRSNFSIKGNSGNFLPGGVAYCVRTDLNVECRGIWHTDSVGNGFIGGILVSGTQNGSGIDFNITIAHGGTRSGTLSALYFKKGILVSGYDPI